MQVVISAVKINNAGKGIGDGVGRIGNVQTTLERGIWEDLSGKVTFEQRTE